MLLPAYLLALGFGQFEVGVLGKETLAAALRIAATGAGSLILCGSLKIAYDLALLLSFRHHKGHQD